MDKTWFIVVLLAGCLTHGPRPDSEPDGVPPPDSTPTFNEVHIDARLDLTTPDVQGDWTFTVPPEAGNASARAVLTGVAVATVYYCFEFEGDHARSTAADACEAGALGNNKYAGVDDLVVLDAPEVMPGNYTAFFAIDGVGAGAFEFKVDVIA